MRLPALALIVASVLPVDLGRAQDNVVSLKTLEADLSDLLDKIATARESGAPTDELLKKFDAAFPRWITTVAPAARHSTGWPEGDAGRIRHQRRVEFSQLVRSRLAEFSRLVSDRGADHPMIPIFSKMIGELLHRDVNGIRRTDDERLSQSFAAVKTIKGFARALALQHLIVAKHQIPSHKTVLESLYGIVPKVDAIVSEGGDEGSDARKLSALLRAMQRESVIRSVNLSEENKKRTQIQQLAKDHPMIRRYLVARQAHGITSKRVELATASSVAPDRLSALIARDKLAAELEEEYLRRCGSPDDRELKQRIGQCKLHQDEVRLLQEKGDTLGYFVLTYNVDRKMIAVDHLSKAAELLRATGDQELAGLIDQTIQGLDPTKKTK